MRATRTEDEFATRFQPVYGRLYAEVVTRDGYFTAAEAEEQEMDPAECAASGLDAAILERARSKALVRLPPLVPIDAYELDREHLDRLLAIELTDEQFAAVERVVWAGGGMKLQHLVWPQYDGESDAFRIATLAGLERLPRLRALALEPTVFDPDSEELAPLRARGVAVDVG